MPEISRFYGIVVCMFSEPAGQHHAPHFHVRYQEYTAVFGIDPILLLEGFIPLRQQRLVEAWAELRQSELADGWRLLQEGRLPMRISPLN